jgi:precorrin-4/cobalt-precorrin-4 C11-methyltransferase
MTVWFIGAGPGDPELLTLKAARLIERCPVVIYAGSLVPREVVARAAPTARVLDSAGMTLDGIVAEMKGAHERGEDVARVHTGDPSIFGAIAEQMRRLDALRIPYEVVPGVSSFTAAAAALKAELTLPGVSQAVVIARAEGRTGVPEGQRLSDLAKARATLALFLSAGLLDEAAKELAAAYGPACPAVVVHKASHPDQLIVRATLADVAARARELGIGATAMVLVGPALAEGAGGESRLYDPTFAHGFRPAAGASAGAPPSVPPRPGTVHLVGAGPGDPRFLTLRAAELLSQADVLAYDELVPDVLLDRVRPGAERIAVGRRHGDPSPAWERIHPDVIARAREGKRVVRLKAGDPFVFGRGGEEAEALREAGIPFEVVPGISAALGAAAGALIPLTHRELSSDVTFATAHDLCEAGGRTDWRRLAAGGTLVLYMGAKAIARNLARLVELGWSPSTPAAWIAGATRPEQRVITGTVGDLSARVVGVRHPGPALLIIGEVVSLRRRLLGSDDEGSGE